MTSGSSGSGNATKKAAPIITTLITTTASARIQTEDRKEASKEEREQEIGTVRLASQASKK